MSAYTDRVDARTVGTRAPYGFASFGLDAHCKGCQQDRASYLAANYGKGPPSERILNMFSDDISQGKGDRTMRKTYDEIVKLSSQLPEPVRSQLDQQWRMVYDHHDLAAWRKAVLDASAQA